MILENWQTVVMVLAIALGTAITRFLPFILFPENRKKPRLVLYLGQVLPAAMIGLLVVYCLRNVDFAAPGHGAPELAAIAVICVLHRWKSNTLISIAGGTLAYMLLLGYLA